MSFDRAVFIAAVQARAARVALGPSALRGQGPGVAAPARRFFTSLSLSMFLADGAPSFEAQLATSTLALRRCFPKGAGSWGLARKLLNIFLRETVYTGYLRDHYDLRRLEPWLEVPLDSITAERVREVCDTPLPSWPGVKHLTWRVSAQYQAAALAYAREEGIARVHLDALWWGVRKERGAV